MKKFSFENQGANTYLVYEINDNEKIDTLSLGMITHNKITGILPTVYTQMDNNKFLKYNISSKIPVKQFFSSIVNRKRLLGVLHSIAEGILAAEEYMIETSSLIFDLEYIYADVSTCDAYMVCLPILDDDVKPVDLCSFYKNIVFSVQFDQTENCDYVAKIINYLNSNSMFSLVDFKQILFDLLNNNNPPQPKSVIQSQTNEQEKQKVIRPPITNVNSNAPVLPNRERPVVQPKKAPVVNNSVPKSVPKNKPKKQLNVVFEVPGMNHEAAAFTEKENKKEKNKNKKDKKLFKGLTSLFSKKAKEPVESNVTDNTPQIPAQFGGYGQQPASVQSQPNAPIGMPVSPPRQDIKPNFGETTVLSGLKLDETTVLGGESLIIRPYMIRSKNNEKIYIDKPVFRIGKEKSYVDYFISDNSAVSRSHANIITRDNNYFVVDTNSKNRTYVDGVMIQSNTEIQIEHGTKLTFANEEFEFRLY